ncbi:sensor histidine kinase [Nostoc sp. 'Peltigera membranacea cyanobiont' 213]|uniref:sensor histidine kinase n=1 Tax=Nostoc sp. 'Peltigera membranacea cyanobiont' 213 TaxID=2014530 RepID=UPI000B9565D9|nr:MULTISPECIES: ATP-binding protein [unclassified Nostoc]AVH62720.1 histidine kinase [Nostoc sp. 'Peltigera membranacea cyanobiont' N6]OYD99071.1 sensor histidine kinase [Nostoc sp. 'Peltigera membranacea cyanobiont' 213]
MHNLGQDFLTDSLFIPHGHCYLWKPSLVWLNIISDSLIALVYYSIPIALVYFVHKRKDFPFKWILLLFGAFIVSCGTTHLMDVWTLWHPTYWLSTFIKCITAIISLYTAIALLPIIPQAIALPSPAQLEAANSQLKLTLKELENTQAQLIQTEKMSSLGQLVAGIAHEINNPVSFIDGNVFIVNEYTKNLFNLIALYQEGDRHLPLKIKAYIEEIDLDFIQEDLPKILSSIKMGANRISKLVLSLRNFSRLDEAEKKEVDIHEGLDSTLLILQNRLETEGNYPDIQIIKQYGNLPKIECYPGQLNQVFMNILNNSIDTLKESGIGCNLSVVKLKITNNQELINYNPQIRICTEVLDTNQVIIRITDNGCGMTEEITRKIFDPFFTTKPVGSGTGLGMSISYQIINKHGGQIKCISVPLQGTEFIIQIPIQIKSI